MATTDTVIVGAGPYGLSLAAHLTSVGVPHEILGKPMQAWRDYMPPGMLMRSEAFASSLYTPQRGYTMEQYCLHKGIQYQPVGMPLSREMFIDYALWFQQQLVSHVRTVDVVDMHRVDGYFHLNLSDGNSLIARRVVLALGLKGFAKTPPVLQGLPREYVSHSGVYGSLDWVHGKDIVIIGGGQSALGLGALMHEVGGRIRVLVRENSIAWNGEPAVDRGIISKLRAPEGGIGRGWLSYITSEYPFAFRTLNHQRRKRIVATYWGPTGAWWLRDRVVGKFDVSLGSEVRDAVIENDRIVLHVANCNTESRIEANHVIAATGFKVDINAHQFLSKEIVQALSLVDGIPELTGNFETVVRGLYIIGPASAYTFGPVMRFIYGAKYAAPQVARHIRKMYRESAATRSWVGTGASSGDAAINQSGR
ncbi:SidA/IucD/PvdA family monooxygenase [Paraburkholderia sp. CNPSo 3157]|uniref:SidA/IucD/PvdA family monooxygenase n=1 Tax=Paraburkholderia franconis TaxID=2654983 RepID=A0A7X1N8N0_9BURK|nr:NAD(P)-binding domain-containing protein [Paraburkholderia franconis]MPW17424.1 SidA/IucD/PvdA family monooxygenase [Paraburkholderia franconis]